ncbi:MAG: hypothetical protein ACK5YU_13370 [Burkholderiales bacterium]|jgi:hypothetical protein|nr:hypothetical protein [Betaproteobacteria bacterium]
MPIVAIIPSLAASSTTAAATSVTPLAALSQWAPIVWLKTTPVVYPILEIGHIVGIALVFGTLWIVDLRILGRMPMFDVNQLAKHILPWTVAGFLLAALTGLTMFVSRIGDLINNPAFVLKIGLLFAAGSNAAVLHARGAINSDSTLTRAQAILSILIWLAVIVCGRWIAYI